MSKMSAAIAQRGRRVLLAQLVVAALATIAAGLFAGQVAALATVGGTAISVTLMLMLRLTMQRAADIAVEAPQASMNTMYIGAALRFIALLAMFAIALGWLGLAPTWLVGAFVLVMLTGVIAARGKDSGRPASQTDLKND